MGNNGIVTASKSSCAEGYFKGYVGSENYSGKKIP